MRSEVFLRRLASVKFQGCGQRPPYTLAHDRARLAQLRAEQLIRRQRRHLDLKIEPVEHRPAHARRVLLQLGGRALASALRVPEPAAAAPLRCLLPACDSSDLGRVCSQGVTRIPRGHWASESASVGWIWEARDPRVAQGLRRLAEGFQYQKLLDLLSKRDSIESGEA